MWSTVSDVVQPELDGAHMLQMASVDNIDLRLSLYMELAGWVDRPPSDIAYRYS